MPARSGRRQNGMADGTGGSGSGLVGEEPQGLSGGPGADNSLDQAPWEDCCRSGTADLGPTTRRPW